MNIFGHFEGDSNSPAIDPGLNVKCPGCGKNLNNGQPRMTISFAIENTDRSYFYRVHKICYRNLSNQDISDIEGIILDTLK